MIIATPNGRFFSEAASQHDGYKWKLQEITKEQARHYCQESHDYIVYRSFTLRERLRRLSRRVKNGKL